MGIHCMGIIRRHMVYNTCGELNHLHGQLQLPQFLRFRTEANLLEAIRSETLELGGLTIDMRWLRGGFYNFEERCPYELPGKFEFETATWTCLDNVLFVLVHVSRCERSSVGDEPLLDLDAARVAVFESMMDSVGIWIRCVDVLQEIVELIRSIGCGN